MRLLIILSVIFKVSGLLLEIIWYFFDRGSYSIFVFLALHFIGIVLFIIYTIIESKSSKTG